MIFFIPIIAYALIKYREEGLKNCTQENLEQETTVLIDFQNHSEKNWTYKPDKSTLNTTTYPTTPAHCRLPVYKYEEPQQGNRYCSI